MTKNEIRAQLKAALIAQDTEISFSDDASMKDIYAAARRLSKKEELNFLSLAIRAGTSPDFNIAYKS